MKGKKEMELNVWSRLAAVTNLGDDYDVFGKLTDAGLEVVYYAFNGLKRIVFKDVVGCVDNVGFVIDEYLPAVQEQCGDDWELALLVRTEDGDKLLITDGCDQIVGENEGNASVDTVEEFYDNDLEKILNDEENDLAIAAVLIGVTALE